jgi:hypothetical protein
VRPTNRARAEQLIADTRQKIERRLGVDVLKQSTADLRTLLGVIQQDVQNAQSGAGEASHEQPHPGSAQRSNSEPKQSAKAPEEDIVDAEVTPV